MLTASAPGLKGSGSFLECGHPDAVGLLSIDSATDQRLRRHRECESFRTRRVTMELGVEDGATLKGIKSNAEQTRK